MVPQILTVTLAVFVTACATDPAPRFTFANMQPDCANSAVQSRWIQAQLNNGGYDPHRSEWEQSEVAQAKNLLWYLRSQCLHPIRPE